MLEDDGTLVLAGQGAVEASAHWPNSQIRKIRVEAGITELESLVFLGLRSLESIFFEGDKPLMGDLGLILMQVTAYYPSGNPTWEGIAADTQAIWKPYLGYGVWGDNIHWVYYGDNTLEISGIGAMKEENYLPPWYSYYTSVETVIFREGITYISKDSLSGYPQLKSIVFPSTLKGIGENAFARAQRLTSVSFPEGLETIGDSAFENCSGLKELLFPMSLKQLGNRSFSYCSNMKKITFQGDAPTIGNGSFLALYDVFVYYPSGKEGWTKDVRKGYGGQQRF